jgi:hypothetical protein
MISFVTEATSRVVSSSSLLDPCQDALHLAALLRSPKPRHGSLGERLPASSAQCWSELNVESGAHRSTRRGGNGPPEWQRVPGYRAGPPSPRVDGIGVNMRGSRAKGSMFAWDIPPSSSPASPASCWRRSSTAARACRLATVVDQRWVRDPRLGPGTAIARTAGQQRDREPRGQHPNTEGTRNIAWQP